MTYTNPLFQRTRQIHQPTSQTTPGGYAGPTTIVAPWNLGGEPPWLTDLEARQAMLEARQANLEAGGAMFAPSTGFTTPTPPALSPNAPTAPTSLPPNPSGAYGLTPEMQVSGGVSEPTFGGYSTVPGMVPSIVRQPLYDVFDEGKQFTLQFELPGASKKDIDLVCQSNGINLQATCPAPDNEANIVRSERGHVQYRRQVPLGVEIVPDKVQAKFADGILTVTVPKKAPTSGPARVEIK